MTIDELISLPIKKPDRDTLMLSKKKWDALAKPIDGLGDFEDIVCRIAAIQERVCPDIAKKALIIMCADNGVVNEGVSQTGKKATYEVAQLMGDGKSSVGVMTGKYPLDVFVYDIGIDSEDTPEGVTAKKIRRGTADFIREPAMSVEDCLDAICAGMDAVKECWDNGYGIIATGEMGIGNTTTSTAFLCAVTGALPEAVTGRGAGLGNEGLRRKIDVIKQGIALHIGQKKPSSPGEVFEALRCLGGLDIAALAGVFIGGAIYKIPIVSDGLICAAAALAAEKILPGCREYMIASHSGKEKGTAVILKELSLKPVINADMALGEGTGAVLLFPMLDMVMELYNSGTVFKDTSIKQYERDLK